MSYSFDLRELRRRAYFENDPVLKKQYAAELEKAEQALADKAALRKVNAGGRDGLSSQRGNPSMIHKANDLASQLAEQLGADSVNIKDVEVKDGNGSRPWVTFNYGATTYTANLSRDSQRVLKNSVRRMDVYAAARAPFRKAREFYELKDSDVGKYTIMAFGRQWRVSDFMGNIQPRDVGKRVYLVGDILQVENDSQLSARTGKAARAPFRKTGFPQRQCDKGDGRTECVGEFRTLPLSDDPMGSNVILCKRHYYTEMAWRKDRNKELGDFAKFPFPKWESLEVYDDGYEAKAARAPFRKAEVTPSEFLAGYIETALWSSFNDDGTPLDDDFKQSDLSRELVSKMQGDCDKFLRQAADIFASLPSLNARKAGGDFWLTRNRHGAGFWDTPEAWGGDENANKLTELAHAMGEVDLSVGDNGELFQSP